MKKNEVTADSLKELLWTTMKDIKAKKISPTQGNSIATQSREICRIAKLQLDAVRIMNRKPTAKEVKGLMLT